MWVWILLSLVTGQNEGNGGESLCSEIYLGRDLRGRVLGERRLGYVLGLGSPFLGWCVCRCWRGKIWEDVEFDDTGTRDYIQMEI